MSHTDETLFTDSYLQIFDPAKRSMELRRKSQREGGLSLLQCMELVEELLRRYQLTYRVQRDDRNILLLPYLFLEPSKGDRILNESTGEVCTVDHVIRDPKSNAWGGLVRLNMSFPPEESDRQVLKFQDDKNYVTFDHNFASTAPNDLSTNTDGAGVESAPMRPTIAWFLARKEPGGLQQPFGPRKELKPRLRESLKDPLVSGHTVHISGQWFDNIVQFDALYSDNRSAESLIEWFEQFMRLNSWLLEKEGVTQTFFWRRTTDDTTREWRQPLWKRSVQYFFRTEQLTAVYTRDLLRVNISLGLSNTGTLAHPGARYIADQLVSGELTANGYRRLFYDQSGNYLFGDIDLLQ